MMIVFGLASLLVQTNQKHYTELLLALQQENENFCYFIIFIPFLLCLNKANRFTLWINQGLMNEQDSKGNFLLFRIELSTKSFDPNFRIPHTPALFYEEEPYFPRLYPNN